MFFSEETGYHATLSAMEEIEAMRRDLHATATSLKSTIENLVLRGDRLTELEPRASALLQASFDYQMEQSNVLGTCLCMGLVRYCTTVFYLLKNGAINVAAHISRNVTFHSDTNFFREDLTNQRTVLLTSSDTSSSETSPRTSEDTPTRLAPQYKDA